MPFEQTYADVACNFFEKILKHTQDQWYGKPFTLVPWQEDALVNIFGRVDSEGRREIDMAYLEVPKKTGKTEFAAGIVILVSALEKTPGSQVYGAGAATRQALNVFRAVCKMIEQSAYLRNMFRILRSTHHIVKKKDPDSFYAAIAADGDLSDGVNPLATICDEVHRWKTRKQLDNFDVLSLGGITRRQCLTVNITTAGIQSESPIAWRLHEKTLRVQQGIVVDPRFYGRIYAAGNKDDWTKESTWIKAIPSLKNNGGFLDIEKIREKYVSCLSDPEAQRSFKRYYLNIWDQKDNRVVDLPRWDKHPGKWKALGLLKRKAGETVRGLAEKVLKHFAGRRCWVGVDMSMAIDMSAVTFVFRTAAGGYEVLPFYWMPKEDVRKREIKDGMPYRTWADQGFLELCEGNVIDERDIKARILWGAEVFDLREICFDPWNTGGLSAQLVEDGYECVNVRQGYATLSDPSKLFLTTIARGKLAHGRHPVMRWNASCLSTKEHNDNLMFAKPERTKTSNRIDGISAAVNALSQAMNAPDEENNSLMDTW